MPVYVSPAFSKEKILFGGGPAGGTFQVAANAIQSFKPIKDLAGVRIQVQSSEGSVDNLKNINAGTNQMGIVYSGDLWQGTNGKMYGDPGILYSKVMAVACLYSASAQLVVHADSDIQSVKDLVDKKVGVGNSGSGAYTTCELFFTHLGIWDKIEKKSLGYNDASYAFRNNGLDAFWVFTALPCPSVTTVAENRSVKLLDLGDDAQESGFLKIFPWFSKMIIYGGTYKGVDIDTFSFQDSAIWAAGSEVSANLVYQMLSMIYTDEGLKYLAEQNQVMKEMSVPTGTIGIITPLHPGAQRFWKEKGILN